MTVRAPGPLPWQERVGVQSAIIMSPLWPCILLVAALHAVVEEHAPGRALGLAALAVPAAVAGLAWAWKAQRGGLAGPALVAVLPAFVFGFVAFSGIAEAHKVAGDEGFLVALGVGAASVVLVILTLLVVIAALIVFAVRHLRGRGQWVPAVMVLGICVPLVAACITAAVVVFLQ